jgi:hypothetical protein
VLFLITQNQIGGCRCPFTRATHYHALTKDLEAKDKIKSAYDFFLSFEVIPKNLFIHSKLGLVEIGVGDMPKRQ